MHPRKKLRGMCATAVLLAVVSLGAMTAAAQEQGSV
jgi:hypothetical protein